MLTPDIKTEVTIEFIDGGKVDRTATLVLSKASPNEFGFGQHGFLTLVTRSVESVPVTTQQHSYERPLILSTEAFNLTTVASWKTTTVNMEANDGQG